MKITIVCKSDSTGGAAVVSRRLMEALRREGVDARMLVAEKLTDDPHIRLIASPLRIKAAFLADRVPIALANHFDRFSLFKMDVAAAGIDISGDPWVKDADAICLNWINQGVLSLKDIGKLIRMGKRIFWTMHDMWNFTGICHHAGECDRYKKPGECGNCVLLGKYGSPEDLSHKAFLRKRKLYDAKGVNGGKVNRGEIGKKVENGGIEFVAVSTWLARRAGESSLLGGRKLHVIPNAFILPAFENLRRVEAPGKLRLIFGAARLDDEIKCFPVLIEAMQALKRKYPEIAEITELTLFGGIKDSSLLDKIPVNMRYEGIVRDPERVRELYLESDIVVSTSSYETLPGTLIEGQAYGCWPVSLNRGGQSDIITSEELGWLAEWSDVAAEAGERIADGIYRGYKLINSDFGLKRRLYESVAEKFSAAEVARKWIELIGRGPE